jgi:hypothetical protein
MSTPKDPLSRPQPPDRVYYANGALLDQEDFTVEQIYHRGRMGRALAYLHGHGTVAGLEAAIQQQDEENVLMIGAGLALDRLGRQIEVPRAACLRIDHWFQSQIDDEKGRDRLVNSFRSGSGGTPDGVVVDVFIKFEVCERGKQPAFATGNFDALDAVAPSRLRDSYLLELVIREETAVPIPPFPDFPDLTGLTPEQIRATVIDYKLQEAWKDSTAWQGPGETLLHLEEHVTSQDGTEVLLARLLIPAVSPPLRRDLNVPIVVDNSLRRFVFSTAELVWLTGIMR